MVIEAENLVKQYDVGGTIVRALDGVNFQIERGEMEPEQRGPVALRCQLFRHGCGGTEGVGAGEQHVRLARARAQSGNECACPMIVRRGSHPVP